VYGYVGTMRATPGNRDEVVRLLLSGADGLREAGCHLYVVGVSGTDPGLIHVTEAWDSKEHHDASLALPAARAAIAQAMPLIAAFGEHRETRPVGGHAL